MSPRSPFAWPVLLVSALVALCLTLVSAASAQAAGFGNLAELSKQGFLIRAEARLLGTGDAPGETLGSLTPERQLTPASVTKVYTAAAALDAWGPQHRFTTELVSTARPGSDGTLAGDHIGIVVGMDKG